jgi:putative drug exporter of the RND superfamily
MRVVTVAQAAAVAFRHADPTIGAAGLILAGNTILAQLGFAVSRGIALAAFVMAMFFSPSLTALIGHRAWWPGTPTSPVRRIAGSSEVARTGETVN